MRYNEKKKRQTVTGKIKQVDTPNLNYNKVCNELHGIADPFRNLQLYQFCGSLYFQFSIVVNFANFKELKFME